jgi:hypothetical protein
MPRTFATDGFQLIDGVLNSDECDTIADAVASCHSRSGGIRSLLEAGWCSSLARQLRAHPEISAYVPSDFVATQCTFFEKQTLKNWLVPVHQDLSIPVKARVEASHLTGWSEKEGSLFVHAPVEELERLVAVRLSLDACTGADGPLKVVPGTHRLGVIEPTTAVELRTSGTEVPCVLAKGSALLMRPLLLHSSSKASGSGRRRVLHFLYGPRELPHGLAWRIAA